MGRAKCDLSVAVCEVLLKSHVSSIDSGLYLSEDMEAVVASFVGFLGAAGHHTVRLNATVVAAAAKNVLGVNDVVAKKFGDAMAHAFSFCVAKGCKAVSGKKLSSPVLAVVMGIRGHASLTALQTAVTQEKTLSEESAAALCNLGRSSSSSSSNSMSSPTLPLAATAQPLQQPQQQSWQQRRSSILSLYGVAATKTAVLEVRSSAEESPVKKARAETATAAASAPAKKVFRKAAICS